MFERYTEKARRVIFFARYEASNAGSATIETEHLLLGLIREDLPLLQRSLGVDITAVIFRKQIEAQTGVSPPITTSKDLPLSDENKRALYYAAKEADHLGSEPIGTDHLLLGLMREEKSFAATLLRSNGFQRERVAGTPLTPEQQIVWRRAQRRTNTAYHAANLVQKLLAILFAWLFIQISWKTYAHELSHFDARFYAVSMPLLLALNVGALFVLRRSGRLSQVKFKRYLFTLANLLVATMGMIVGAR